MSSNYGMTAEGQRRLLRAQAHVLQAQAILGEEFESLSHDCIGLSIEIGATIVLDSNPYYDAMLYGYKPRNSEIDVQIEDAFASIKAAQEAVEAAELLSAYGYA